MLSSRICRGTAVTLLAAAALAAVPRAGGVTADGLLRRLSESYYDLADAGLARASCRAESPEILDQFDRTARKVIGGPDYEVVLVPGKPLRVTARDVPANFGRDARAGVAAYCFAANLVLNAVFKLLDGVPALLHPAETARKYDSELRGAPGKWRIVLTSRALVDGRGRPVPPWRRNSGEEFKPKERIELILDEEDRITSVVRTVHEHVERSRIELGEHRGRWLIREIDVGKYDHSNRLIERRLVSIKYTDVDGIQLPSKIRTEVVDKQGRRVRRRDQANPATIRFSRYRVELRQ